MSKLQQNPSGGAPDFEGEQKWQRHLFFDLGAKTPKMSGMSRKRGWSLYQIGKGEGAVVNVVILNNEEQEVDACLYRLNMCLDMVPTELSQAVTHHKQLQQICVSYHYLSILSPILHNKNTLAISYQKYFKISITPPW